MLHMVIALVFFSGSNVQSLQVIPQKINVTYINEKYIKWANLTIKRYGRKSDYYVNIEGEKYHTWDNNITINLVAYEYLHNEYRRSFIEMKARICDMINHDPYAGRMFYSKGIRCPILIKETHLMNLTFPTQHFPYVFPFEKGLLDGTLTITNTGELVMGVHMFTIFKDIDIRLNKKQILKGAKNLNRI